MLRNILFATAVLSSTAAMAVPRAEFLRDAIRGDYSEMQLGRLIQNRGYSAQVRNFGTVLVRDHSAGLRQAQNAAARSGLHIPLAMMPEARSEQYRLRRLHGRAFDFEVRRYMINDHRKDLVEFRAQAHSGDRITASLATSTIPVLQRHLAIAQSIRG